MIRIETNTTDPIVAGFFVFVNIVINVLLFALFAMLLFGFLYSVDVSPSTISYMDAIIFSLIIYPMLNWNDVHKPS